MTATKKVAAVFLLMITQFAHGDLTIEKIDGSSGLYFEETGELFFYANEWKIVSNVNLTKYHTEFHNIQNIVNAIKTSCAQLKQIETEKNASITDNEECGPKLYQLNILMADIEENHSNWFGKDTRTKRHVLSELVYDHSPNDFVSLVKEFTNMSARATQTSTSVDQETSYIMSSMNSFGKSADRLAIKDYVQNQLTVVHNTLAEARNGSVNADGLFQLRTTIQDIISYQMLILNTFASKQKQYLSIMPLVGMKNVQISSVLSSDTVINELNNIRNVVIERGLGFPMKITTKNVHFLFHISTPEIALYRDQIFVTFKLPLISKLSGNYFSLFKVTSVLTQIVGNFYNFVAPNHEFIAIDAHKEKYITLTVDDLTNCRQMTNATSMICKQSSSAMLISTSTDFEINVLLKQQKQEVKDRMNERYIRNNAPIFIKILKPNSWLVTMPQAANVRYMCEGKPTQEVFVQMNGLVTIDNNCKMSTYNLDIIGHNTFPKRSVREHQINKFTGRLIHQSDDFDRILKDSSFKSNNVLQVISFGESEKLFRISSDDELVKTKVHTLIWDNFHETMLMALVVVSVPLLAVSFVFSLCELITEKRKKKANSTSVNPERPTLPSKTTDSSTVMPSTEPSAPLYPSVETSIELN